MLVTIVIPKKRKIGFKCRFNSKFTFNLNETYLFINKKFRILLPNEVNKPNIA